MRGALSRDRPKNPPRKEQKGPVPLPHHPSLTHLSLGQTDLPLQILRDHFPSGKENLVGRGVIGSLGWAAELSRAG